VDNCIFCGESFGPDRKRSKEHAAAKWCGKIVPSQGVGHHILVVETADGVTQEDRGLRDPFTTTAGGICAPCNNGWMEEMEDWAERWLTAPITGNERTLRYWRQALAATWAVKTAMVWESVAPKNRTIPLEVLRMFHRFQRPGARQQVWVGRYSGSDPHSFRRAAAHVAGSGTDVQEDAHGYLIALSVGELALIVYGHLLPHPAEFVLQEDHAAKLVQIWPPVHEVVDWPPSVPLDDAALEACVRSLGESIPQTAEQ